jgi:hypothetical protein
LSEWIEADIRLLEDTTALPRPVRLLRYQRETLKSNGASSTADENAERARRSE